MNMSYSDLPNGYLETIDRGIDAVRHFTGSLTEGAFPREEAVTRLRSELETADAVVAGAGAGLSTAAGFIYTGERFEKWFPDFIRTYGIRDMYSGGFFPFPSKEIFWAYWARYIYINRYLDPPKPVYGDLFSLLKDTDYFVITTNVDHCFQKAGFDRERLFYTQGDYGLFQSTDRRNRKTYDNEEWVMQAMEAQGFVMDADGVYQVPQSGVSMKIPTALIPKCPDDGSKVTMNLRADDSFVEDEGWYKASAAYAEFIRRHEKLHTLYLEIGVGANTPVIIKYPFWAMTAANPKAVYACLNYNEAFCPKQIEKQSICIDGDTWELLKEIRL